MAANGLNTGIDTKLVFTDATGIQHFAILESFSSKEDASIGKEIDINGNVRHPKFHAGWSGSFKLQRSNNVMDLYIALQEAAYYRGVDQLPMIITQTITEVDGSISQYQFTNVVITLEDAGTWAGTEVVKQSIMFSASRKELRL